MRERFAGVTNANGSRFLPLRVPNAVEIGTQWCCRECLKSYIVDIYQYVISLVPVARSCCSSLKDAKYDQAQATHSRNILKATHEEK